MMLPMGARQWVSTISEHPPLPAAALWVLSPVAEAFGNNVMSSITVAPPWRCPGAASSPESRAAGLCGFQGMKKNFTRQGSFFFPVDLCPGLSLSVRLDALVALEQPGSASLPQLARCLQWSWVALGTGGCHAKSCRCPRGASSHGLVLLPSRCLTWGCKERTKRS